MNDHTKESKELMNDAEQIVIEAPSAQPRTLLEVWSRVLDSIDEAVSTAKRAGTPLIISHHKCAGVENWGRTTQTLPRIAAAACDHRVNVDVYPYAAGSTNLRADLVTDRAGQVRADAEAGTTRPAWAGDDSRPVSMSPISAAG